MKYLQSLSFWVHIPPSAPSIYDPEKHRISNRPCQINNKAQTYKTKLILCRHSDLKKHASNRILEQDLLPPAIQQLHHRQHDCLGTQELIVVLINWQHNWGLPSTPPLASRQLRLWHWWLHPHLHLSETTSLPRSTAAAPLVSTLLQPAVGRSSSAVASKKWRHTWQIQPTNHEILNNQNLINGNNYTNNHNPINHARNTKFLISKQKINVRTRFHYNCSGNNYNVRNRAYRW